MGAAVAARDTPTPVVFVLLVVTWLLLLSADHCYDPHIASRLDQVRRVGRCGVVLVAAAATGAVLLEPTIRPGRLLALAVITTTVSAAQRLVGDRWTGVARARVPVVVAGHRRDVARVLGELERSRGHRYRVAGVCVPTRSGRSLGVPETCGFHRLTTAVVQHGARAVIVVPCRHLDPMTLRRLSWQLEASGTSLMVASGLFDVAATRARIGYAGDLPMLHVRHAELTGARRLLEAAAERAAAALALVLLAPLLAVLALAVRRDTPGPALFRQTRVGRNGRPFSMLKLRSMVADAEERRGGVEALNETDGVLFKVRSDPRVTRVGAVLRRYSLDELPQLVNVVRGEMSLVGPRPPLPEEVERYDPDTRRRLAVRPGITGLWQVSGRSDLSWEETVRLDLRYVDNWSLGLDLRILLRTVRAVLRHDGAY
ncbi:exopolysaccharide biosynthesis polyprenyl glycosylphosphotransferase [Nocardioides sp. zg-578]|uniref:Exopolysaccharide biosynthesis polyprenyl glycosylphosphotransferase n=2 Tax=Nocardioides marmotae TaxID=2663857 RepID=A0A6I3JEF0_9ACTN|nr:exopolysaccharide biosynthesis polyprenyl glycosylphosphotransferase [Nocardioides marmotae]MCR6032933.1 exopolysaccharide biosynthesis polyprenyl glycosylphosphotransferase [Gordonia jinghuaiqii]MTB84570.1 exopolysaccharide biosynthesis polyprenyl glycosylphosphotransferase [Nocardioides marmotae]MTB96584.1 exopolysaccharide biosynthesis polyprenyl glycosylphosphotransferase [Nocardioides marmotae]QKE03547.1 exopolysaccharide biosynthesis polyprenyl glycosylphosphotransferase [Nocardioides 